MNSAEATVWAAVMALSGVFIAKAVDYVIARFGKEPSDNGEFRAYLLAQNKATSRRVDQLTAHVLQCEQDRLRLHEENQGLRRRLDLLEAV